MSKKVDSFDAWSKKVDATLDSLSVVRKALELEATRKLPKEDGQAILREFEQTRHLRESAAKALEEGIQHD